MYDPNARAMVCLSKEKWMAMKQYYDEHEEQYEAGELSSVSYKKAPAKKAPAKKMVEVDCEDCHGTGYWQPYLHNGCDEEEDCPECDGLGYIKGEQK